MSRDAAKEVLGGLVEEGGTRARSWRARLGAMQRWAGGDGRKALAADPAAAEEVRAGNQKALGPLVGVVMRETKGRADGGEVRRLILEQVGA